MQNIFFMTSSSIFILLVDCLCQHAVFHFYIKIWSERIFFANISVRFLRCLCLYYLLTLYLSFSNSLSRYTLYKYISLSHSLPFCLSDSLFRALLLFSLSISLYIYLCQSLSLSLSYLSLFSLSLFSLFSPSLSFLSLSLSIYLSLSLYVSLSLSSPTQSISFSFSLYLKGDVRMLLTMACNCLDFAMDKYKKALASAVGNEAVQLLNSTKNPFPQMDGQYYFFHPHIFLPLLCSTFLKIV